MKKFLLLLFLALIILIGILLFNTYRVSSPSSNYEKITLATPPDAALQRLQQGIQIKTISPEDTTQRDNAAFKTYLQFLKDQYPLSDSLLQKEQLADYSLLYTWKGTDTKQAPILLMAHTDVVPIEDPEAWKEAPFSGKNDGTYIWGRGSLDDKCSVQGILEATEWLLKEGYQPKRTICLAFGHDEEVGGRGAQTIVKTLKERKVKLDFVLDEGMVIVDGMVPGISKPAALIGVAEKGFANLSLSVKGTGGHSSMPPSETSISILSKALTKVSENQMPARLDGAVLSMFDHLGAEMEMPLKLVFANKWLFKPIIMSQLSQGGSTNASIRTTTAPTMLEGSNKANVLPATAKATINFRLLPGDEVSDIIAHLTSVIGDERVIIAEEGANNPASPISSTESPAFEAIKKTIGQLYEDVHISPALTIATTDSRFYVPIANDVYRFLPVILNSEDIKGIHGSNERIKVEDYQKMIQFYYQLIKNSNP